METTPNPKCNRCKCYWKSDETDIKTSGLVCKTCKRCRGYDRIYKIQNADKIKEYTKERYENNPDKYIQAVIKCRNKYTDKYKEYNKQYHKNNADNINQRKKKYREENKDKIKKYHEENKCEHNKHRYCKICNLQLYLIHLQRSQLRRCLNNSSLNKTKSSIEYLGCDAEYFIEYMKKKMDIWNETNEVKMDFTNIHIDHIKPVNAFNLDDEDEFLDCCNYTNMQPLLVNDNLRKKNKWTDDDDIYWCNNIINKEHLNIYIN